MIKYYNSVPSVTEIHQLLKKDGVLVIENYLSEKILAMLNKEFDQILNSDSSTFCERKEYSMGRAAIIRKNKLNGNYDKTYQVFSDQFMKDVSNLYLAKKNNLNDEIFVVEDVVGSKHIANDLHFDVLHTLKFFIYLTDTNSENGAFQCVPGSLNETQKIRAKQGKNVSFKNRDITRSLPYSEDQIISVDAQAGSLIIFDTDTVHRAGQVTNGTRRVMRGHTRISSNRLKNRIMSLIGLAK